MATSCLGRILYKSCSNSILSAIAFRGCMVTLGVTHSNHIKLNPMPTFISQNVRLKYSSKGKGNIKDEDSDTDSDEEEYFENERDSKIVKTKLNSLRADLILKSGLSIARNKIEEHFYQSKIRVNGEKILKKSLQLQVGDEIDVIKGPSPLNPEHLIISRVVVVSATPKEGNLLTVLRRYKTMTVENYKDAFRASE
uniref:Mitochondrial transcription rescue factor 1 C-terminal domain-containing protein n=1 Tax=Xenopsylla cheopis TaxID=163159 RepID=A0A6M2DN83_XENCH